MLASHVVQGSSTFLDVSLILQVNSSVLLSMMSFHLQRYLLTATASLVLPLMVNFDLKRCTGNE